jgi:hypothetical protein
MCTPNDIRSQISYVVYKDWLCHILHGNCLIKRTEGEVEAIIELAG